MPQQSSKQEGKERGLYGLQNGIDMVGFRTGEAYGCSCPACLNFSF